MLHKCEYECECVLYGKMCPKSAANIALFFLPWQHWQIRQKTMAKQKKNVAIKKYEKFFLSLSHTLSPTLSLCWLVLYFIEIDFLGCECICASILLLLYGMLYIHISLAQSPLLSQFFGNFFFSFFSSIFLSFLFFSFWRVVMVK